MIKLIEGRNKIDAEHKSLIFIDFIKDVFKRISTRMTNIKMIKMYDIYDLQKWITRRVLKF